MGVSSFFIHLEAKTSVWTTDVNDSSVNYCQNFNWLKCIYQSSDMRTNTSESILSHLTNNCLSNISRNINNTLCDCIVKGTECQTQAMISSKLWYTKSKKSIMRQSKAKGGLERLATNQRNTKGIRQQKQETQDGKMWQGQEWGENTGFNTQGWIN